MLEKGYLAINVHSSYWVELTCNLGMTKAFHLGLLGLLHLSCKLWEK